MDPREEVVRAANQRADALARGDADLLGELLHEEFRWTAHVGEIYDRREYIRRNTEGDVVWHAQDLTNADVVVVDATAVLYAEASDVVLSDTGARETFRMPMTQVWIRQEARWTCLAGHAGPRR